MIEAEHLNSNQIAGYLDHGLSTDARGDVEQHLDLCEQCRSELAESARLSDSLNTAATPLKNRHRLRRWMPGGIAAAIAAALLIFATPRETQKSLPTLPAERGAGLSEGRAQIEPVSPLPNTLINARSLKFTWHRASPLYRFTLLNDSGRPLFMADTQDTTVIVPDSVALKQGRNYFWRVDGTETGVVSTTGALLFNIK